MELGIEGSKIVNSPLSSGLSIAQNWYQVQQTPRKQHLMHSMATDCNRTGTSSHIHVDMAQASSGGIQIIKSQVKEDKEFEIQQPNFMNLGVVSTVDTQTYNFSGNLEIANELKNIQNYVSKRELEVKQQKLHGPIKKTPFEALKMFQETNQDISNAGFASDRHEEHQHLS